MASPDFEIRTAEERLAELEYQFRKLLPAIQSTEMEWLVARFLREKKLCLETMPEMLKRVWKSRYVRIPVSIRDFICGKHYLNLPIGSTGVYPKIVEVLETQFKGEFSEVILGGSIGWGKSTYGSLAVAYDLYRLSCLRDPAVAYGMKTGSNMTFVNISVDKRQAEKVFFADLYNLLKGSWYFNHVFPYDRSLKNEIRFPKNVQCYPVAASEQAALGVGVFCAFIDEVNFFDVTERSKRSTPGAAHIYDQAEAVFNKLQARIRSRMNLYGKLPGRIYAASSARYPDDFTERMAKRAKEETDKGERNMLCLSYALWETIPKGKISSETFRVEVGDITRRTRVLTGDEEDVIEANVIDVPEDFRRAFDRDPDLAARDLAGKSVYSIRPFISRREMIHKMFELGKAAGLKHPFTKFDVSLQERDPVMERLMPEHLHWITRPKLNEYDHQANANGEQQTETVLFPALYYAHVDLSKSGDATGLVIAHNIGARKVPRLDVKTGKDVEELKPIVRVDLALRVVAPRHGEIEIPRVRAIFYELNRRYKMEFGKITFDTYGSQESVKTMKNEGFNADLFSVDKNTTAYDTLREAIYDERIFCYHVPVLERELIQLERSEKKIDHPATRGGSKDLADALAGAVQHCQEGWRRGEGARGLFKMGMVEYASELPQVQDRMLDVQRKAVAGEPMTAEDEDNLLFDSLLHDLLTMDDKERFGDK